VLELCDSLLFVVDILLCRFMSCDLVVLPVHLVRVFMMFGGLQVCKICIPSFVVSCNRRGFVWAGVDGLIWLR